MHTLGLAHLIAGNYDTAAALFKERIQLKPESDWSRAFLAAALGHLGEIDEARRVWAELRTVNPNYSFTEHVRRLPFENPADVARIAAGLGKAGLPIENVLELAPPNSIRPPPHRSFARPVLV